MPVSSTVLHPPQDLAAPLARLPASTASTISVQRSHFQGDLKLLHWLQEGLGKHLLEELDTGPEI